MEIIKNFNSIRLIIDQSLWINAITVVMTSVIIYWIINKIIQLTNSLLKSWDTNKCNVLYQVTSGILNNTKRPFVFFTALLLSIHFVNLQNNFNDIIFHCWFFALALQIAIWLDNTVYIWLMTQELSATRNPVTVVILGLTMRILIWAIMLLSILDSMGVNITALVASLGVGGIAIALAIQTVLSDVFASLAIGFDKPFIRGDFVTFNDIAGTIEHIGLKTTRIRSLSGEQIVCANAILLQQTIHNYKRMQTRRVVFKFSLACSTPTEKLRLIGKIIQKIIEEIPDTNFNRAHLLSVEDFRLTFEVVHTVSNPDYNSYMNVQQEINIRLIEELKKLGVRLAMPAKHISFNEAERLHIKLLNKDL